MTVRAPHLELSLQWLEALAHRLANLPAASPWLSYLTPLCLKNGHRAILFKKLGANIYLVNIFEPLVLPDTLT